MEWDRQKFTIERAVRCLTSCGDILVGPQKRWQIILKDGSVYDFDSDDDLLEWVFASSEDEDLDLACARMEAEEREREEAEEEKEWDRGEAEEVQENGDPGPTLEGEQDVAEKKRETPKRCRRKKVDAEQFEFEFMAPPKT
jgi:hypothetical protein